MGLSPEARWGALRALVEESDDDEDDAVATGTEDLGSGRLDDERLRRERTAQPARQVAARSLPTSEPGWDALRELVRSGADDAEEDSRSDLPRDSSALPSRPGSSRSRPQPEPGWDALRELVRENVDDADEEPVSTRLPGRTSRLPNNSGRFGLGRLEQEPVDEEEDSSTQALAGSTAKSSGSTGWSALRALVTEPGTDDGEAPRGASRDTAPTEKIPAVVEKKDVGAAETGAPQWDKLRELVLSGCGDDEDEEKGKDAEAAKAKGKEIETNKAATKAAPPQKVAETQKEPRPKVKDDPKGKNETTVAAPESARWAALRALAAEGSDDGEGEDKVSKAEVKANKVPKANEQKSGMDALRALVDEEESCDEDQCEEEEEEEEEEEHDEEEQEELAKAMLSGRVRLGQSLPGSQQLRPRLHEPPRIRPSLPEPQRLRPRLPEPTRRRAVAGVDEADYGANDEYDDEDEEEEEENDELNELDNAFSEGSERMGENPEDEDMSAEDDMSDFDQADGILDSDPDADNASDGSGDGGGFSEGLLSGTFSGGSLHATAPKRASLSSRATGIRVVFPTLIWRGRGIMVLNKPADWICSASDVHRKMGRPDDPLEKVSTKGFKTLDDLQKYKFRPGDKKYIHWWIQLIHDLDQDSYPNLFDVNQNYGLCHRLDRETSGAMLVGLTQTSRQLMRQCFHRHYVRKLYVCLAHGRVKLREQTIDKNLESMGQRVRISPKGQRARTHVKVLGYYSRTLDNGDVEDYTLCTCEIAEGRMHQIRIHMSEGIGSPIVSEIFYQDRKQMAIDRNWCSRVFLHAYAVGFPDVTGGDRNNAANGKEKKDEDQEWHCCICPITEDLREVVGSLDAKDEESTALRDILAEKGMISDEHSIVHVRGSEARKKEIDNTFFPWSSVINPFDECDLSQPKAFVDQRTRPPKPALDRKAAIPRARGGEAPARLRRPRVTRETGSPPRRVVGLRGKASGKGKTKRDRSRELPRENPRPPLRAASRSGSRGLLPAPSRVAGLAPGPPPLRLARGIRGPPMREQSAPALARRPPPQLARSRSPPAGGLPLPPGKRRRKIKRRVIRGEDCDQEW